MGAQTAPVGQKGCLPLLITTRFHGAGADWEWLCLGAGVQLRRQYKAGALGRGSLGPSDIWKGPLIPWKRPLQGDAGSSSSDCCSGFFLSAVVWDGWTPWHGGLGEVRACAGGWHEGHSSPADSRIQGLVDERVAMETRGWVPPGSPARLALCPLAGCSGALAKECTSLYAGCHVTVFDMPDVVQMAKRHFSFPEDGRISFREGGFPIDILSAGKQRCPGGLGEASSDGQHGFLHPPNSHPPNLELGLRMDGKLWEGVLFSYNEFFLEYCTGFKNAPSDFVSTQNV